MTRKPDAAYHDLLTTLAKLKAPTLDHGTSIEFEATAEHAADVAFAVSDYLKALFERAREECHHQTSMTRFDPGVVDAVKDNFCDELRAMRDEAAEDEAEAESAKHAARYGRRHFLDAAE